jgi:RimJ/RimL family protein N-acetyltransferase
MRIVPLTAEIAPRLERLFSENRPIPTRLWAVLDSITQGRILVDNSDHPTFALVQDLSEGTTYLGGAITAPALRDAFAIARRYQEIVVCMWFDAPLASLLPAEPDYEGVAIDFSDRSPAVDLDRLAALPAGFRMQRIDERTGPAMEGFEYYVTMFGSAERAIRNMIGYCLMHGETVVCEAVAAPLTRGVAEMGIDTAEGYRQKGLATAASAYVIRECEALGYRAFWNAAQQNVASVALARRLGFRVEQPFTVLAWSATHQPATQHGAAPSTPSGLSQGR